MTDSTLHPVIAKELEDYTPVDNKKCSSFFKENLKNEGLRIVLFQVPKDFDISTLEGKKINVDELEAQILNEEEDESLVLERYDENCEDYMCNQVLPVLPDKHGRLGIRKKITKAFKLYKKYGRSTISSKNIIKQVPMSIAPPKQD